ncbi:penicillin acylase family protein [Metabacillus herbersteinensis]|uniref:Penicillin acylase family protein n=1 Tax=Metabacillus herbersteinensis TaxID=283816 RepID=A0ABV6GAS7_9BACI
MILQEKRKTKRWVKFFTIIGLVFFLLAGITYTGIQLYLNKSLPVTSGTISLQGLTSPVSITRDNHGVPHIKAENLQALYIAQGYVTAQDRLFQMDLSRRQASGELSEVIGEAALDRDKFFRTFGLRRAAEASYTSYSEEAQEVLEWYADGVNLFMEEAIKENKLPVEFTLLGYVPREWSVIDSLTIGKYMAFDLGGHWEGQAFRYQIMKALPENKALELFPSYPKDGPDIVAAIKDTNLSIEESFANSVIPDEFNGSNNWVVSGSKTKSGEPLLADDPHLSLATPSIWYQSHLQSPEVNVSGVIFAGIPGIILGHNEQIAWGVTNVGPDVQDLYIEKRNQENPHQFLYKEKWEDAEVFEEEIKVKDRKSIDYEVTVTRHGPIISEFAKDTENETALALQWTALQPSNELEAVLQMNQAENWDEFKEALNSFHTPAQNFVFASKDGTIAYRANGKIPIRSKGDGQLPVPGWTGEYEWKDYIPFDELPTIINPEEGFISTANNQVIDESYPYHITNTWAQPYRAERIKDVLESKDNLTVKDMQELQMDQVNLQGEEFVPLLSQSIDESSLTLKEKKALALLSKWDFMDNKDSSAPLLFHHVMNEINEVLFEDEISEELAELFEGKNQIVDQLLREADKGKPGVWITEQGGLSKVMTTALKRSVSELETEYGKNMGHWKWGNEHRISFTHPLSTVSVLKYLFNPETPIPIGGSRVTVQAAGWNSETGLVTHGGSWRFAIDLADIETGYHLVGPGQSGHVKSKWYHDQMKDWANGTYHATKLTDIEGDTLTLVPTK